jgi:hypothetical protein
LNKNFGNDAARKYRQLRGHNSRRRAGSGFYFKTTAARSTGCARQRTGLSFPTATKGIDKLMNLDIVKERTGGRRNRVFSYERYLAILNEGTEPL